jgi:uncharacterized membrane protein
MDQKTPLWLTSHHRYFAKTSLSTQINTKLEDKLPSISTRVKGVIAQIYENLMAMLHEEQNHQHEQRTQLFDDLSKS